MTWWMTVNFWNNVLNGLKKYLKHRYFCKDQSKRKYWESKIEFNEKKNFLESLTTSLPWISSPTLKRQFLKKKNTLKCPRSLLFENLIMALLIIAAKYNGRSVNKVIGIYYWKREMLTTTNMMDILVLGNLRAKHLSFINKAQQNTWHKWSTANT